MSSVSQRTPDIISKQKEGTGTERIALLFCTLFFLAQLYSLLFNQQAGDPKKLQLDVIAGQTLVVIPAADFNENHSKQIDLGFFSQDTFHLSPFFFHPIPINFCNIESLMSVKGIGPSLAKKIIEARTQQGGFSNYEDLLNIKGIGQNRLQNFKPYLYVSTRNE